jgi:hypothetical protein
MEMIDIIVALYPDETFLKADGLDEAIIGLDEQSMRLIYSVSQCIEIFCREMSLDDAVEHFEYNTKGAYVGEKTPIWCDDNFLTL